VDDEGLTISREMWDELVERMENNPTGFNISTAGTATGTVNRNGNTYITGVDWSNTNAATVISTRGTAWDAGYTYMPYIPMQYMNFGTSTATSSATYQWITVDHFAEHEELFKI
jgi:hypothetical protein